MLPDLGVLFKQEIRSEMWKIYIIDLKIYWERNVSEHDENGGRTAATRKYRYICDSESDFSKLKDMSYELYRRNPKEILRNARTISSSASVITSLFETEK